jgi:3-oxoadipate CoA-transferase beta subunit
MKPLSRRQMAWRAAQDLQEGDFVNLGIGIPTLVANYIPADREVILQSENGVLGIGPTPKPGEEDPDLVNAGKGPITLVPGGSFFNHNDSFLMIRGGHITVALMGALEVSAEGDLANWTTNEPGGVRGVGGAMDLAAGARQVRIICEHTTKDGKPRIRKKCVLPLTAPHCVRRIYSNLAVMDIGDHGVVVREIVPGLDIDGLQRLTEAELTLANDWKVIEAPQL